MPDIDELEKQRRSLTARIRAAKKAAIEAERLHVETVERELGRWVLDLAFGADDGRTLDERADAVRATLGREQVTDILRNLVQQNAPVVEHGYDDRDDEHEA